MISPPVEPTKLLSLHRRLREGAHAEILETGVSRDQDTVVKVTLLRPIPLVQMLSELPDVVSVTEEPYAGGRETTSGALSGAEQVVIGTEHTIPKRFRVVLK